MNCKNIKPFNDQVKCELKYLNRRVKIFNILSMIGDISQSQENFTSTVALNVFKQIYNKLQDRALDQQGYSACHIVI